MKGQVWSNVGKMVLVLVVVLFGIWLASTFIGEKTTSADREISSCESGLATDIFKNINAVSGKDPWGGICVRGACPESSFSKGYFEVANAGCPSDAIKRNVDSETYEEYDTCCFVPTCESAGRVKMEDIDRTSPPEECAGFAENCHLDQRDESGNPIPCCCVFEG